MAEAGGTEWLDLHIASQRQLFNSMDPAPFRERDLDPDVSTYVREWAEELSLTAPLGVRVTVTDEPATGTEAASLRSALHENFARSAAEHRRNLKKLFRDGRISLVIGVAFLGLAIGIAEWAAARIPNAHYATLVEESVVIGGWVALWQPINIFLYDWWPIRRLVKLYDRLARADVVLTGAGAAG
jgi:hypothetical protein